jgi:pyruvate dehydrogenase E2 component (dihydrolipoamide acetyltransferase)
LTSTAQYTLNSSANASGLLAVRKKMKASALAADININDLDGVLHCRALLQRPDQRRRSWTASCTGMPQSTSASPATPTGAGRAGRARQPGPFAAGPRATHERAGSPGGGRLDRPVDDLSGGTFTVSNLGSFGVESFTPVLNPPQVAILGVNAIGFKPVRKPDGNIEFIDSIGLSLTVDHQVVDGAPGARFLRVLRDKIENAEALCTI